MADAGVRIDDKQVRKKLDQGSALLSPDRTRRILTKIAMLVKINILSRTASGMDSKGKMFAEYTPRSIFFRQRNGRPTDKVDLNFKGHMLGSISTKAIASEATIFFADKTQNDKAFWHHYGTKKMPAREFFALSANDIVKIDKTFDRYIKAELT